MKIVSKAQQGLFGAISSGSATKRGGPTREKARKMLRENKGLKVRDLPRRASKRTASRRRGR